ncbi:hypothetical protein ACFQ0P_13740 [Microbacterium insulae]|uniref:Serine/threonine protein kinase n=1 Tax=Microbacterium insulae TaxID=483014 RepID=A0ABW3AL32_9MICO
MPRPDESLTSPYRAVRPITAPTDGPWPGMLVCLPSGDRGVLVDAELLGAEWGGWDVAPDGHILGAIDVVRRAGGHDALLPVCPEHLESYLARRGAHAPLSPGEAVTIGVSLLRGCTEAREGHHDRGSWWLTEAGRPVFAPDRAGAGFRETTLAVMDLLTQAAASHPAAWDAAAAAVSAARRSAAELDRAELGLFQIATPVPLDLRPLASRAHDLAPRISRDLPEDDELPRGLWGSLARHADADVADLVSRATTSVWRRLRIEPTRAGRRAPLVVGAAVAAVIIGGGLLWPAGDDATAEGSATNTSPTPTAVGETREARESAGAEAPEPEESTGPMPTPQPEDAAAAHAESDLGVVAGDLLARLDACGEDAACRAALTLEGAAAEVVPSSIPPARRSAVLLDDYGGVAALRLDDTSGEMPSQFIVIARQNGEWLLRDVRDATQQP